MAQRLDMVSILVRDIGRMVAFYRDVLGFRTDWTTGPYCEFDHHGVRFSMYERQKMDAHFPGLLTYPSGLNGSFALAIDLPRFEDVDPEFERLVKAGAKPVSPPKGPNPGGLAFRACWIADPEGNLIELGSWNKGE
ncbi:MAG: VOC family protein [Phycisphaeraceae bacterium]|nr:VOC family protein [Phycisphaeraceae bacterium]